jgi:hypothetical protein
MSQEGSICRLGTVFLSHFHAIGIARVQIAETLVFRPEAWLFFILQHPKYEKTRLVKTVRRVRIVNFKQNARSALKFHCHPQNLLDSPALHERA